MSPLVRIGNSQEFLLNYWCLNTVLVTCPFDSDNNGTRCHAEENECHKVTPTQGKVGSSLECGKLGGTPSLPHENEAESPALSEDSPYLYPSQITDTFGIV